MLIKISSIKYKVDSFLFNFFLLEIAVTRKLIKYLLVLFLATNVFAGGDDSDEQANIEEEIAAFEAQLEAELAAQQAKLAEEKFEAEYAAQQAKLEAEKFEADYAAQQAKLEAEKFEADYAAQQAKLAEEKELAALKAELARYEECKSVLDLSDSNIALFKSALVDGSLFSVGPQITSGTEFTANRWDDYASCIGVLDYKNPF